MQLKQKYNRNIYTSKLRMIFNFKRDNLSTQQQHDHIENTPENNITTF